MVVFSWLMLTPTLMLMFAQLSHDAKSTLRTLNVDSSDAFEWTFMRDLRDPQTRFDVVIRCARVVASPIWNDILLA